MKRIDVTWAKPKNYYKNMWLELRDGGSGQWLYAVSNGLCFIFIDIIDMVEYCGREADALFAGSVKVVDLAKMPEAQIASALQSCGFSEWHDEGEKIDLLDVAECCIDYGAHAPMWSDEDGKVTERFRYGGHDERHPAFRTLRANARKYAETLFDVEVRDNELDTKVVNAIGASALEYMNGDLWGVLRRAKENPTPQQALVLKMYSNCKKTLGGEDIPEDLRK